ncbi:hypothetical protein FRC14_006456 [Serendipita sp. 396]|nr:hypothetical protein FRC14_006456 [Serendipita sp. 396]KAG8787883.1 hypothetical protein FRC15_007392 [Serendipita sp. 397]KAG8802364.1 hypothetical protein FRC16_009807 [Serendipita sp. 398]KAG8871806.1 hypothetical protein FRC20_010142 [Serendipita sp. 405]
MPNAEVVRAAKLFQRFKIRELARKPIVTHQPAAGLKIPTYSNPFLPGPKREDTKCRLPSRYSLRRQKELFKAAKLLVTTGKDSTALNFLPLGPKMQPRVIGGGVDKALSAIRSKGRTVSVAGPTSPRAPVDSSTIGKVTEVVWEGKPSPRKQIGMYDGRKTAFKLHRWEREREGRQKDIQKQVHGMDQRISEWRNRRTGRTAGAKLPF